MRSRCMLVSVIALSSACTPEAARPAFPAATHDGAQLAPAELQADFDLMRSALEEAHAGIYRYVTKPDLDRTFARQRAQLGRPMSKFELFAVLMKTTAAIRCGHTGIQLDAETLAALPTTPQFPLRIMFDHHKMVVVANETNDSTIRPGMEVLEINHRTSREIVDAMLPTIPTDGDIEAGKWRRLETSFAWRYWLVVDPAKEFTIVARNSSGATTTATLAGVTAEERKQNHNPVNDETNANLRRLEWSTDNLGLRFLKGDAIAEIRIRSFGGDDYPQWLDRAFRTLRDKSTAALVLDLRGNGGGDDMYGAMLVSYLTDKPFRYFDHIRIKTTDPSFKAHTDLTPDVERSIREGVVADAASGFLATPKLHPGITEQQPAKYPFLGKTIILIDGRTFSTAADVAAVVHHLRRATFIGEETGGAYLGNNSGEVPFLTLPNSKAQVRVPLFEYWNAVGVAGNRRGTLPDLAVETTAAKLLAGVDEQLDAALALVEKD